MDNSCYLIIYWNYDDVTAKVIDIYYTLEAANNAFEKKVAELGKDAIAPSEDYLELVSMPVELLDEDGLTGLPDDEADFSTWTYFEENEDIIDLRRVRLH